MVCDPSKLKVPTCLCVLKVRCVTLTPIYQHKIIQNVQYVSTFSLIKEVIIKTC